MPNIIYNSDSHVQLTQAALLGEGDLAIIFSNSGITKDCIEISRICHANGAHVVFATMFLKTPASAYSDVLLPCGANEGPMEGGLYFKQNLSIVFDRYSICGGLQTIRKKSARK
ncbi:HTH-type transcriptional regulator RpiR [Muribaculaceae bacterium]|nr:HTH-type transcriptional regulator RpiR [Muribaculaceae bacterium]